MSRLRGPSSKRCLQAGVALALLAAVGLMGMVPRDSDSEWRAPSSRPDVRPAWSKAAGPIGIVKSPNLSLLSRPKYAPPEESHQLAEWLQPSDTRHSQLQSQMREEWSGRMNALEMRERHNLSTAQDELEFSQNNSGMGRMYLRSLLATQVRDTLRKAEKNSEPVRVVSKAQEKLDFIANQGMKLELAPDTQFGSKADVIRQRGSVWMNSPWLNGTMDFQLGGSDPYLSQNKFPGQAGPERYRLTVGRSLPWELQTGMVYGGSSRTMTTSLSRPLLPNLSCTLENRKYIFESSAEQMARLNYQLRF